MERVLRPTGAVWAGGYIVEIGVDFEVLDAPELAECMRELERYFAEMRGRPPICSSGASLKQPLRLRLLAGS